mmetsp:Transcript_20495/g.44386  ORF Transcript_20495/g.44386 Transcript_20495/m.44386 type:complete len:316 (-) Transcript_20495:154-1101(-)
MLSLRPLGYSALLLLAGFQNGLTPLHSGTGSLLVSANDGGLDDPLDDPSNPCSTHALNAYRKCIRDNPCTCRNCQDDPNDPDWVIEALEPRSCQDISRIFCPYVRCCSACEAEFSFYHACLADKIASLYLTQQHNCQLFICANPFDDFEGECGPTAAPVEPENPCATPMAEYETCVTQDSTCAGCPFAEIGSLHLEVSAGTTTCQDINYNVFCPLESCCPACNTQLDAVATCVETNLITQPDDVCPNSKCPPTPAPVAPVSPPTATDVNPDPQPTVNEPANSISTSEGAAVVSWTLSLVVVGPMLMAAIFLSNDE